MDDERQVNWIAGIAERKIAEAIEQGVFDNLPGRGKPLVLDDHPWTPPHLRVVNRMLRNARVVPEWVAMERDIEDAKAAAVTYADPWLPRLATVRENDAALAVRSTPGC